MNSDPPATTATTFPRLLTRLVPLGMLVVCAVILGARKPDMIVRPQFWAEDGGLFYLNAYTHGADSVFMPYAGYLHVIPRLIALLADVFDPAWAPAIYVGFAGLLTLWIAGRTLSPRFPLRPRLACALAVVLVPDAFEVLLNVTNLQWILAAGLAALLISDDPETIGERIHDVATAILVGLTGPFSTLFAPLFVARAVMRRTWWSAILAALVVAAGVIQFISIVRHPTGVPPGETAEWAFSGAAVGSRIGGSLLLGKWVPNPPSMLVGWALGAITVGGVAWLAFRPGAARAQRIGLGLAFFAVLAASLYRCRFVLPELRHAGYGARYFYPLQMLVLWLGLTLLTEALLLRRIIAGAVLAIIFAVNLPRLREGALEDMKWADQADRIRTGEPVVVPINPGGWTIPLPGRKP